MTPSFMGEDISLDDLTVSKSSMRKSEDKLSIIKKRFITKREDLSSPRDTPIDDAFCDDEEVITWPKIAETLDRVFFISFTVSIAVLTIVTLPAMLIGADYLSTTGDS